ncbi:sensor domain-containing protein [Nocardia mexicana]|uniref:sensor domain-containing protein n=1 Tax=Nocardia mexicana TaxID=279262 RepID=UPI001FE9936A|nr:sensor domain-containing protein [Nocardia mexicana]
MPDSPGPRPRRKGSAAARVLGGMALTGLLAACGQTVPGTPEAMQQTAVTRHIGTPLARLLPGQDRFPARYTAVVLPVEQARRAVADLAGVPAGSLADPEDCAPPQPRFDTDRLAVVVGTDNDTRATITVELSRTDQPMARLRDQLGHCEAVRVQRGPLANAVVTQVEPPPPVSADDALALRRTVSGPMDGPGLTQSMRLLVAQIGDVRINATYMSFDGAAPDMRALGDVFDATVANVRKG